MSIQFAKSGHYPYGLRRVNYLFFIPNPPPMGIFRNFMLAAAVELPLGLWQCNRQSETGSNKANPAEAKEQNGKRKAPLGELSGYTLP